MLRCHELSFDFVVIGNSCAVMNYKERWGLKFSQCLFILQIVTLDTPSTLNTLGTFYLDVGIRFSSLTH